MSKHGIVITKSDAIQLNTERVTGKFQFFAGYGCLGSKFFRHNY